MNEEIPKAIKKDMKFKLWGSYEETKVEPTEIPTEKPQTESK